MRAQAANGCLFLGWRDACTGPDPQCDVIMDAPKTADATFAPVATWDTVWSPGVTFTGAGGAKNATATTKNLRTNIGRSKGKFYWEIAISAGQVGTNGGGLGLLDSAFPSNANYIGASGAGGGISFGYNGFIQYFANWAGTSLGGAPPTTSFLAMGNVYMFALDLDNQTAWFGNNGTWYGGGDPGNGANASIKGLSGTVYPGATLYQNSPYELEANFGSAPFKYPPPPGFARGFF